MVAPRSHPRYVAPTSLSAMCDGHERARCLAQSAWHGKRGYPQQERCKNTKKNELATALVFSQAERLQKVNCPVESQIDHQRLGRIIVLDTISTAWERDSDNSSRNSPKGWTDAERGWYSPCISYRSSGLKLSRRSCSVAGRWEWRRWKVRHTGRQTNSDRESGRFLKRAAQKLFPR